MMIQRCHKWRQKRKQYIDQARVTTDDIERERLLQAAEHYGRIVTAEQGKIDSSRGPSERNAQQTTPVDDVSDDEALPEFITKI